MMSSTGSLRSGRWRAIQRPGRIAPRLHPRFSPRDAARYRLLVATPCQHIGIANWQRVMLLSPPAATAVATCKRRWGFARTVSGMEACLDKYQDSAEPHQFSAIGMAGSCPSQSQISCTRGLMRFR